MGAASNWDQPEAGTWVDARIAWFVVDSDMRGGMGASEAVPFGTQAAAESFRGKHGGRVVQLDGIPDAYVMGPWSLPGRSRKPAWQLQPATGRSRCRRHAGHPPMRPAMLKRRRFSPSRPAVSRGSLPSN